MYEVDVKELRKRMVDNNIITIEEFSKLTGINRSTLSDIINGRTRPSSYSIERIAKALNLTPEEVGAIFYKNKLA